MYILKLLEVALTCFSDAVFLYTVGFKSVNLYKKTLNKDTIQKEKKKGLPVVKLCTVDCSVPPLINVWNTLWKQKFYLQGKQIKS